MATEGRLGLLSSPAPTTPMLRPSVLRCPGLRLLLWMFGSRSFLSLPFSQGLTLVHHVSSTLALSEG